MSQSNKRTIRETEKQKYSLTEVEFRDDPCFKCETLNINMKRFKIWELVGKLLIS